MKVWWRENVKRKLKNFEERNVKMSEGLILRQRKLKVLREKKGIKENVEKNSPKKMRRKKNEN